LSYTVRQVGAPIMGAFLGDLKFALRGLRKNPTFTITAIVTLALGIGANGAIFSVINAVLLQPLPYPDAKRVVSIGRHGGGGVPEPVFAFWEQNNPGLDDLTACTGHIAINLNTGMRAEVVSAIATSRNYFGLFGANPIIGRTFNATEDSPRGPRAVVISYGLWQKSFDGNPSILGSTVILGGAPYSIVGVLSPSFKSYPKADIWIPLQVDRNSTNQAATLDVYARLPREITLAQATARMQMLRKRYAETRSRVFGVHDLQVDELQEQITGTVRPALVMALGAVGFVLLIACANVTNLLLARATVRQKEIAIRSALGAGRFRIFRQLVSESLVLAIGAGILGLLLGSWSLRGILHFAPNSLPDFERLRSFAAFDPKVAAFTFALAVVTAILCSALPAIEFSRPGLINWLGDSSRTSSNPRQKRTRNALVALEVSVAAVLLCGALLLARSFVAMHEVKLGFEPRNLLTVELALVGSGYDKASTVDRISRQLVQRTRAIPGVESAAMASALPLQGGIDMIFSIPGRQPLEGRLFDGDVQWRIISTDYFKVLQIPLIAGRFFNEQEPRGTVLISEAMARQFWPGENPVGKDILIGPNLGPEYQVGITRVVGVVGDVRERLDVRPQPVMYQMPSQIPDGDMALLNQLEGAGMLIRTRGGLPTMSISHFIQKALFLDNQLSPLKFRTMEEVGIDSTADKNFNTLLLGSFSAIALLLAAVGIYGVMSYGVEQRTHEIGIRAAIGANRSNLLRLVMSEAIAVALAGIALGIAASFGLTRFLRNQLFGVKPSDPVTLLVVPLLLLLIAIGAAYVPALRATRVDPLIALRRE
jgi:putative ABC transport system permease protein